MSDTETPREEANEQNPAEAGKEVELSEDDLDSVAGGSQDWEDPDW